jgi:hypothetical protein
VCVCVRLPRAHECDVRMSVCKCFSSCVCVCSRFAGIRTETELLWAAYFVFPFIVNV